MQEADCFRRVQRVMKKSLCGELRGKAVFDLDTAISSDADKALKISEPQFEKKKKISGIAWMLVLHVLKK